MVVGADVVEGGVVVTSAGRIGTAGTITIGGEAVVEVLDVLVGALVEVLVDVLVEVLVGALVEVLVDVVLDVLTT